MNNLVLRALTGAVYVCLICAAVILKGWIAGIIFGFIAGAAVNEFITLAWNKESDEAKARHKRLRLADTLLSAAIVGQAVATGLGTGLFAAFGLLFLYLIVRPVVELYTREDAPVRSIALSYMAHVYITVPLCFLPCISAFGGHTSPVSGIALTLAVFVMIWLSDTGAYLVGSAIGRHKLFPRISPAKSWEGFAGGVLFATLSGLAASYAFPDWFGALSPARLCGLGLTVAIFSTWGDLVESLIKRSTGVKDSGRLLPGHGGMLDRIDSLLLVIPASLAYLSLTDML